MEFQSVRYGNTEGTLLLIVCADGTSIAAPWPSDGEIRQFIQAWLDAGNTPEAFEA